MDQQKKKRGENWSGEEKEILRQLIYNSAHIIEDKSTKTNINLQKNKEWKNISNKFNELTGKVRSDVEIKLAWKRMKLAAKSNISAHRREQAKTGGGEKPPSPSAEDLEIMAIAPSDFIIDTNDYDSDAVIQVPEIQTQQDVVVIIDENPDTNVEVQHAITTQTKEITSVSSASTSTGMVMDTNIEARTSTRPLLSTNETTTTSTNGKKNTHKNSINNIRQSILNSNADFKKRQLEMMEEEHIYNIEIAKLKIKKLKLEITQLEFKENK